LSEFYGEEKKQESFLEFTQLNRSPKKGLKDKVIHDGGRCPEGPKESRIEKPTKTEERRRIRDWERGSRKKKKKPDVSQMDRTVQKDVFGRRGNRRGKKKKRTPRRGTWRGETDRSTGHKGSSQ